MIAKPKLENKIIEIEESHDLTVSSQIVFPKDLCMYGTSLALAGKINTLDSKWFEPRSISSSRSVIVRVSVVLKRTVGDSD